MKDKNNLFITVGIPTFNSSKYLFDSLNSVINCTSVNEIIISDDGSSQAEIKKLEQTISTLVQKLIKKLS